MFGLTRTPPPDADGDSTMHSSDDEMFPDEAAPSTPRNAAAFALNPASELSPPNSQGPSNLPRDDNLAAFPATPSALNANGKRVHAAAVETTSVGGTAVHTDSETGYHWSKTEDQPGYAWKNNKAREDESRALDQIVDKAAQIKS